MNKISLCSDLMRNPRESEDSRIVASKWSADSDIFLPEIPPASKNAQYYNLTAERFIYRRKILGLSIDRDLSESKELRASHPFGSKGPECESLLAPRVSVAMAFVPLASNGGDDGAIMARLYCVDGLTVDTNWKPPFRDGLESQGIDKFSWFVAGVPEEKNDKLIVGRSWLLAANLLRRIVKERDTKTARNLAERFIVTGDVVNGNISKVEMYNKPQLAKVNEFSNKTWIIPMKNENEMNNVSIRRIVKPETLDEAYELIKSMQTKATRSLFEILSKPAEIESKNIIDLLQMGADPTIVIQSKHRNSLQIFDFTTSLRINHTWNDIEEKVTAIEEMKAKGFSKAECLRLLDLMCKKVRELPDIMSPAHDDVRMTLMYYGGIAQMFFLLAKSGEGDLIKQLCRSFDIDACDCWGKTALDFAEEHEEFPARDLLVACGAKRRGRYEPYSDSVFNIIYNRNQDSCFSADDIKFLHDALENGLDPNFEFHYGNDEFHYGRDEDYREARWNVGEEFKCRRRRHTTTLLLEALYAGNEELIRDCFAHGANPETSVSCAFCALQCAKKTFKKDGLPKTEPIENTFKDDYFEYAQVSVAELVRQDAGSFSDKAISIYKELTKKQKTSM